MLQLYRLSEHSVAFCFDGWKFVAGGIRCTSSTQAFRMETAELTYSQADGIVLCKPDELQRSRRYSEQLLSNQHSMKNCRFLSSCPTWAPSTVEHPSIIATLEAILSRLSGVVTDFTDDICHESCSRRTENNSHVDAVNQVHIPRERLPLLGDGGAGLASLPIGGIFRPSAEAPSATISTPHNPGAI